VILFYGQDLGDSQEPKSFDRQHMVATEYQHSSPTRKLIHLAMALMPAAGWWVSFDLALALAGVVLVASFAVEAVRRGWPWVNRLLWQLLPTTFRAWEGRRILGSTWFAVGAVAAFLLFGRDVGGTAILFLSWGDPVAELAGRRWGQPGQGKTLAGSVGCLLACLLAGVVGVGLGGLSLGAVVAGAIVATLVERWSPPPDDNVWIPVLSGLAVAVVEWSMGGQFVLFPMWR
jgi:dolichol kinase